MDAYRTIKAGEGHVILAGGMESMSRAAHGGQLRHVKKMGPLKLDQSIVDKGTLTSESIY